MASEPVYIGTMNQPIYVVSGLPRSGTSMMMKMLDAGGLVPVTDNIRTADDDNPKGYYELEAVKRTKSDDSWVTDARGKVVKVIAKLLEDLPTTEKYRVIFMRRNLDEVLKSQQKMLERRNELDGVADSTMKESLAAHVEQVESWMRLAEHVQVLFVSYNRIQQESAKQIARVAEFCDCGLDQEAMTRVVDPQLYRQRV